MEVKTIGGFLAALRKEKGMTQKELAELLNVSDKTISRWERDDGSPDLAVLPVLAAIFGVSCDELLAGQRRAVPEPDMSESDASGDSTPEAYVSETTPPTETQQNKRSSFWKVLAIVLSAALIVVLGACLAAHPIANALAQKSLYVQGMELIDMMEEMAANEDYIAMYAASPELQEVLATAAQSDRSEPKAVYEISVPKGMVAAMAELSGVEGLSDDLKAYVAARTHAAIPTQINAANGANVLAAASVCTAGKTFVSRSLTENTIYLYTYEDALPAMVVFTPGEDHAVSASACFVFNDDFVADYVETVEVLFAELGAEVSLVER